MFLNIPDAIEVVPPKETELPLIVIDELARLALLIAAEPDKFELVKPVTVLEPAAIVLLVKVCDPVVVTTVAGKVVVALDITKSV